MVRSLFIRRTFALVDTVLAVLIVVAAVFLSAQAVRAHVEPAVTTEAMTIQRHVDPEFDTLRGRGVYDGIVHNGLFGEAGRLTDPPGTGAVASGEKGVVFWASPSLDLKLLGVTSLSPTSQFATATIENAEERDGKRLVRVGDVIVDGITIQEIRPRSIILLNNRSNPPKRERLSME